MTEQKNGGVFYGPLQKFAKQLDLIVIRVTKIGELAKSRPCYNCLNMMKDIGIRRVYYTVDCINFKCEHVKDMISIESSGVTVMYDTIKMDLTSEEYFELLLRKYLPKYIKKNNFDLFIEYNLKDVCPKYKYIIKKNHIYFYNSYDKYVAMSIIKN